MTFHPEDTERLRHAFSALADDDGPTEVDNERVWQAVRGELSQEDLHELIEEMAHDPALAESWRIAHALSEELGDEVPIQTSIADSSPKEEAQKPVGKVVALPRRAWKTWGTALAAVAAMAVFSIGLHQVPWGSQGTDSIYRDAEDAQLLSLLIERDALPREDFTLRWSNFEGAHYELRVLGSDLRLLTSAKDLDTAEFRVDVEVLAEVPSGTRLLWQVDAHLPDGRTLTSATFFAELE